MTNPILNNKDFSINMEVDYSSDILGSGYNGTTYRSRKNNLCIKKSHCSLLDSERFKNIRNNIMYIIDNCEKPYVGTFNFEFNYDYSQYKIFYRYSMEVLNPLTDDEWKLFHTLVSHEDSCKVKDLSSHRVNFLIKDLSNYLDYNVDDVKVFCEDLVKSKIKHLDLHPRNIMKDNKGNFKLIDLDNLRMEK